jgi:type I restriction enzyme S subunit
MAAVDDVSGEIIAPEHRTLGEVRTKSYRTFAPGDVLFAKITPCMENGKSAVVPDIASGVGFGSTEFHVLRPHCGVNPRFIWHYVRQESFRHIAEQHMTGSVGQARVPATFLEEFAVPLPPEVIQTEIVRLLDAATHLDADAAMHLDYARRAIDRFRQAVLAAACSGRLTADWREQNKGVSVDPLLKQLLESHAATKRPLAEPDTQLVGDVPSGWGAATLDLLIERIEAGKSFAAEPASATDQEWGVIKVSAMSWGRFLEAENKAVTDRNRINPAYEIRPGDLLISRANTVELVGATVLVGTIRPHLLLSDKSLRLIPRNGIDKAWLNYTLRSPLVRSQFSEQATGTSDSMRNLSQVKILSTAVPLPPTDEQREIGRRVEQLVSAADELQQRIQVARRGVERSSQSVLAKAFRGELGLGIGNNHGSSDRRSHLEQNGA